MDKLKVNYETFKAIESLNLNSFNSVEYNVKADILLCKHSSTYDNSEYWKNELKPLNNLSISELATALLIGYELEKTQEDLLLEKLFQINVIRSRSSDYKHVYYDGYSTGLIRAARLFGIDEDAIDKSLKTLNISNLDL